MLLVYTVEILLLRATFAARRSIDSLHSEADASTVTLVQTTLLEGDSALFWPVIVHEA